MSNIPWVAMLAMAAGIVLWILYERRSRERRLREFLKEEKRAEAEFLRAKQQAANEAARIAESVERAEVLRRKADVLADMAEALEEKQQGEDEAYKGLSLAERVDRLNRRIGLGSGHRD